MDHLRVRCRSRRRTRFAFRALLSGARFAFPPDPSGARFAFRPDPSGARFAFRRTPERPGSSARPSRGVTMGGAASAASVGRRAG
ncbi:hypothetical protein GCM10010299_37770 [Streptomyces tanashiensis]|nr:hypothetical protein GCM10010299_37770 [Streptomyces tanashiensis]